MRLTLTLLTLMLPTVACAQEELLRDKLQGRSLSDGQFIWLRPLKDQLPTPLRDRNSLVEDTIIPLDEGPAKPGTVIFNFPTEQPHFNPFLPICQSPRPAYCESPTVKGAKECECIDLKP